MVKKITSGTNILPNNPMEEHGLLAHLKEVKGTTGWYEFNLKCLVATYPDDKVFKDALEAEQAKVAAAAQPTTPPGATEQGKADKETKATDATTAKKNTPHKATKKVAGTKGQGNGK
jgi:hypothetical protein